MFLLLARPRGISAAAVSGTVGLTGCPPGWHDVTLQDIPMFPSDPKNFPESSWLLTAYLSACGQHGLD